MAVFGAIAMLGIMAVFGTIIIGIVATGMVMVISAGRGIATGRMMGIGILMVSNMNPIRAGWATVFAIGAIMAGA
jgi:hypothetical protein